VCINGRVGWLFRYPSTPDVYLWTSILKGEELLGKLGSKLGKSNKKLKSDGLHLVRISSFSLNFFSLVTKEMEGFYT
jgi:hypothetical protein